MKKGFLILIIIFSVLDIFAQKSDTLFSIGYIQKVNIISPSFGGEFAISKTRQLTFNYNIGVKVEYQKTDNKSKYYNSINNIFVTSYARLEIRNYMNHWHRIKERPLDKYSGAYGSFKFESGIALTGLESAEPYYIEFGPMIGFQQAIGNIWYWDVSAGVGPNKFLDNFAFTFFSSIKFGFAF